MGHPGVFYIWAVSIVADRTLGSVEPSGLAKQEWQLLEGVADASAREAAGVKVFVMHIGMDLCRAA